jgi:hypothetical protein
MPPFTCIIIPLHAKGDAKVVNPTSTPSHHSRSSGYDRCILPFVDVKAKECIGQVDEKEEEGMKMIEVFTKLVCMIPH